MTALANQKFGLKNLVDGLLVTIDYPAAATQVFYKGAAVGLNASGFLVPMAVTTGLRYVGVVDLGNAAKLDTTGFSNGDFLLKVQAGIWNFKNSGSTDAIVQADMGKPVYFVDDQTVAKTDGGVSRPVAGIAIRIEGTEIMVLGGFPFEVLEPSALSGVTAGPPNTVTSGALGLTRTTFVSVTATVAFTLADGLRVNQRKSIRCTVAGSTPVGTLTPATPSGFATILFDAVNETAELEWTGAAWVIVNVNGATPS